MQVHDKYIIYGPQDTGNKVNNTTNLELTPRLWQNEMLELLSFYNEGETSFTPVKIDYSKADVEEGESSAKTGEEGSSAKPEAKKSSIKTTDTKTPAKTGGKSAKTGTSHIHGSHKEEIKSSGSAVSANSPKSTSESQTTAGPTQTEAVKDDSSVASPEAAKQVVKDRDGEVLKSGIAIKEDQFPGIDKYEPKPSDGPQVKIPGAPNFRKIPGENSYGTGLPTEKALKEVLESVGSGPNGDKTAVWTNLREEPVIYINGKNYTLRDVAKMNKNMENPGASGKDIEKTEETLKQELLREAAKNGGKILLHEETPDGKTVARWVDVDEKSVKTTAEVFEGLKKEGYKVDYKRIPISDEKRPEAKDFDEIVQRMKDVDPDTPVIFNCQAGRGRTTTALIAAGLVRRAKEGEAGKSITKHRSVHNKIMEVVDRYYNAITGKKPDEADFKNGEYKLVSSLIRMMEKGPQSKEEVDKLIDKYDAVQNLREAILESREKGQDPNRPAESREEYTERGKQYLERYFYLILFNEYTKQQQPGYGKSFEDWTKENPQYNSMLNNLELAMGYPPTGTGENVTMYA